MLAADGVQEERAGGDESRPLLRGRRRTKDGRRQAGFRRDWRGARRACGRVPRFRGAVMRLRASHVPALRTRIGPNPLELGARTEANRASPKLGSSSPISPSPSGLLPLAAGRALALMRSPSSTDSRATCDHLPRANRRRGVARARVGFLSAVITLLAIPLARGRSAPRHARWRRVGMARTASGNARPSTTAPSRRGRNAGGAPQTALRKRRRRTCPARSRFTTDKRRAGAPSPSPRPRPMSKDDA
ncbi:hypothetical protein C8Q76DRAFT_862751, partial [Earliella scabrosa]